MELRPKVLFLDEEMLREIEWTGNGPKLWPKIPDNKNISNMQDQHMFKRIFSAYFWMVS